MPAEVHLGVFGLNLIWNLKYVMGKFGETLRQVSSTCQESIRNVQGKLRRNFRKPRFNFRVSYFVQQKGSINSGIHSLFPVHMLFPQVLVAGFHRFSFVCKEKTKVPKSLLCSFFTRLTGKCNQSYVHAFSEVLANALHSRVYSMTTNKMQIIQSNE